MCINCKIALFVLQEAPEKWMVSLGAQLVPGPRKASQVECTAVLLFPCREGNVESNIYFLLRGGCGAPVE